MNLTNLTSSVLAGLLELEQSGDLVLTHPAPIFLAERLCAKVIQDWGKESLDEPIESALDLGMKQSVSHIEEIFKVSASEAESALEIFVRDLGATRSPREVAELICHQGAEEIALGAFFCAHLQRGDYYSSDYLDWRKAHYAQNK